MRGRSALDATELAYARQVGHIYWLHFLHNLNHLVCPYPIGTRVCELKDRVPLPTSMVRILNQAIVVYRYWKLEGDSHKLLVARHAVPTGQNLNIKHVLSSMQHSDLLSCHCAISQCYPTVVRSASFENINFGSGISFCRSLTYFLANYGWILLKVKYSSCTQRPWVSTV